MEIENLFLNYKETRWTKFKAWVSEEMAPFWSNWMSLRQGFVYATWAVIGIWYVDQFAFNVIYGEYLIAGIRLGMVMWYAIWCSEAHSNLRLRKTLHRTFDSWTQTIEQWRETARSLEKLEHENAELRRQLNERV